MTLDPALAEQIAGDTTQVFKKLKALRQHAPRVHPEVEASVYPILFCLDGGARRVSAIAEAVHSDVSTVSRQVCALETTGLVAKTPDPTDGRAHVVGLTESGRTLTDEVRLSYSMWFANLLAEWSEEDARNFSGYLKQLQTTLDAAHDSKRSTLKEVK